MATNVKFYFTNDLAKYNALETKDPFSLYFIEDEATGYKALYKGENLMAVGSDASTLASGLMSAKDKQKLDDLVTSGGGISNLQAVDGSLVITDGADGKKNIAVALSTEAGNILSLKGDGLYVDTTGVSADDVPSYEIEKQADSGDAVAVYKLKKTVGTESSYVGDAITIPKDLVISSGSLEIVAETDVPYVGAVIGEPYLDIVLSNADSDHIYIPVKGLVDTYKAGDGLQLVDGTFSANLGPSSNGLHFVDGTLNLALATSTTAGALSAVDKVALDKLIALDIPTTYGAAYEISNKPTGTLVNYNGKEIRVMCPVDTEWALQNVGEGGDSSKYYIGFKAYAPSSDVVSFKESLAKTMTDQTMYYFEGNEFAGIDSNGRKYSIVWLPVAKHNDDDTWTYYGANSTANKLIGWDYCVEWYDANGVCVASDLIRINLANEDCVHSIEPYYMSSYVTDTQLETAIADVSASMSWGEL